MGEGGSHIHTYIYMSCMYIYVKLLLISFVVWQKPTQCCKAVVLRLKINLKKIKCEIFYKTTLLGLLFHI